MREILFRGQKAIYDGWVYGSLAVKTDSLLGIKTYFILNQEPRKDGLLEPLVSWHNVKPETVGQYTGLKDKNGRRIFEGDIVDHYYQKGFFNRGVVMWDSQNARFAHELRSMSPAFSLYNPEAWEIIGNIHDNPELLKKADR